MSLVLELPHVMTSKYSKFYVDIFDSFQINKQFWIVEKGHNCKNITFGIMSLVLQLPHVMTSKYSMFHVDIFDSFQIIILNKQFWQISKLTRGITPHLQLSELCPLSCHCILSRWTSVQFSVDILSTLWVMGYIKVFARQLQ